MSDEAEVTVRPVAFDPEHAFAGVSLGAMIAASALSTDGEKMAAVMTEIIDLFRKHDLTNGEIISCGVHVLVENLSHAEFADQERFKQMCEGIGEVVWRLVQLHKFASAKAQGEA